MGQGALSKPVVQWWLSLNSSNLVSPLVTCTYAGVLLTTPRLRPQPPPRHWPPPSSPDLWVGATEGTAESAASAVAVGNVPTDTADGAVDGTYIAHIDAATPLSPDLWVDATGGTTESSASAVAVGNTPADTADGATATADSSAASGGMHGASDASVTKKRRQKHSHAAQDSRKHRRRVSDFDAAQGGTSGSDPGPMAGHPAGDRAER